MILAWASPFKLMGWRQPKVQPISAALQKNLYIFK